MIRRIHFIEYSVSNFLNQYNVFIQQTDTAYPNSLNTAYRSPYIIAETDSSYLIFVLDFLSFFRANPADIFTIVTGRANHRVLIQEDTTGVITELILRECIEKAQAESSLAIPKIDNDVKIELNEEFLMELRKYCGMDDEDVVDHIAKVFEILDLIITPNVDTHRLCMMVFPLSLAGSARQWWINEGDGKITT
ncbi:hypothetical protein Tco_1242460 [Tanacetum coccineum]